MRDDVALDAIAPPTGTRSPAASRSLSHAFLSRAARDRLRVAARPAGRRATSTAWRGSALVGALPLYAKTHSYGEYVFDWGWADAYRRYGRRYYPKLVAAIPFTPAPGPRLLAADAAVRAALLAPRCAAAAVARAAIAYSSLHVLFPDRDEARALRRAPGMIVRNGVQFHWDESRAIAISPTSSRRSLTTSARR